MKTGDILLCSGTSWLSDRIAWFQHLNLHQQNRDLGVASKLTHVAGVVSFWQDEDTLVYESTTNNKWAVDGAGKSGTQMNPYDEWFLNYPGGIWIRELNKPIKDEEKFRRKAFHSLSIPYENGIPGYSELILAAMDVKWLGRKHRITKQPHCTEAWATQLMAAGVLYSTCIPSRLPPCEWWGNGKLDSLIVEGYSYSEPILLKEMK